MLWCERKPTVKREQYDWMDDKNLEGLAYPPKWCGVKLTSNWINRTAYFHYMLHYLPLHLSFRWKKILKSTKKTRHSLLKEAEEGEEDEEVYKHIQVYLSSINSILESLFLDLRRRENPPKFFSALQLYCSPLTVSFSLYNSRSTRLRMNQRKKWRVLLPILKRTQDVSGFPIASIFFLLSSRNRV